MKAITLSLDKIAGGALNERFGTALQETLRNMGDPNTDEKNREINIKLVFKIKSKDRSAFDIDFVVSTKHRPEEKLTTTAFMEKDPVTGQYVAAEYNLNQPFLPFDEPEATQNAPGEYERPNLREVK